MLYVLYNYFWNINIVTRHDHHHYRKLLKVIQLNIEAY